MEMQDESPEPTLVLRDAAGDYYLIPAKHMPLNRVSADQVGDLEHALADRSAAETTESFQIVNVVEFERDLRRKFTLPNVIDVTEYPSPPS